MNWRRRHEASDSPTRASRSNNSHVVLVCALFATTGRVAGREGGAADGLENLLVCFDVLARSGFPDPNGLRRSRHDHLSVGFDENLLLASLVCNTHSCGSVLLKEQTSLRACLFIPFNKIQHMSIIVHQVGPLVVETCRRDIALLGRTGIIQAGQSGNCLKARYNGFPVLAGFDQSQAVCDLFLTSDSPWQCLLCPRPRQCSQIAKGRDRVALDFSYTT